MIRSLFFFAFVCLAYSPSAQVTINPSPWNVESLYPGGRIDDGAGFRIGESLYFGTGIDQSYTLRKDWWKYDLKARKWHSISNIPSSGRQYALAFATHRLGYLFGGVLAGNTFTNECFRYDPLTDQWQTLPNPPWSPRAAMACFRVGERVYVLGGRNDSIHFTDAWMFDLSTEEWVASDSLPFQEGRDEMVGFAHGNVGYVMLGRSLSEVHSDMWRYNTLSGEWKSVESFEGEAVSYAAAVRTKAGAVIAGGQDADGKLVSASYYFDASTESFEALPDLAMGEVRGMQLLSKGDSVYSFGGLTHNFTRIQEVQHLRLNERHTFEDIPEIILVPNPARDRVAIFWAWGDLHSVQYNLYDITGRLVKHGSSSVPSEYLELSLTDVPMGVYLLSLSDGSISRKKVLVVSK
ncbi:MAG: T9SS type A sorting domain-containing protein [Flavobacteriales bacterium]|nr:T9SS type A sorting domain-containing protein [Flavobacteriales bacterium]